MIQQVIGMGRAAERAQAIIVQVEPPGDRSHDPVSHGDVWWVSDDKGPGKGAGTGCGGGSGGDRDGGVREPQVLTASVPAPPSLPGIPTDVMDVGKRVLKSKCSIDGKVVWSEVSKNRSIPKHMCLKLSSPAALVCISWVTVLT